MKNEIVISFQDEVLQGNVLDVGFENYGVIYNTYKNNNNDFEVEYIDSNKNIIPINRNYYDICVLFLCFNGIMLKKNKKKFLYEISCYLKEDGYIYIWDVDKPVGNIINNEVKVIMSEDKVKKFEVKDYNLFKDSSESSIINLIEEYFDIMYARRLKEVYCIKARRKRRTQT